MHRTPWESKCGEMGGGEQGTRGVEKTSGNINANTRLRTSIAVHGDGDFDIMRDRFAPFCCFLNIFRDNCHELFHGHRFCHEPGADFSGEFSEEYPNDLSHDSLR